MTRRIGRSWAMGIAAIACVLPLLNSPGTKATPYYSALSNDSVQGQAPVSKSCQREVCHQCKGRVACCVHAHATFTNCALFTTSTGGIGCNETNCV